MNQQLKQCLGIMREVEVVGQRMAECSCCGKKASVSCVGEACRELFCLMCGKSRSACMCSFNQRGLGEVILQVEPVMCQTIPMGFFTERG